MIETLPVIMSFLLKVFITIDSFSKYSLSILLLETFALKGLLPYIRNIYTNIPNAEIIIRYLHKREPPGNFIVGSNLSTSDEDINMLDDSDAITDLVRIIKVSKQEQNFLYSMDMILNRKKSIYYL